MRSVIRRGDRCKIHHDGTDAERVAECTATLHPPSPAKWVVQEMGPLTGRGKGARNEASADHIGDNTRTCTNSRSFQMLMR